MKVYVYENIGRKRKRVKVIKYVNYVEINANDWFICTYRQDYTFPRDKYMISVFGY